MALVSRSRWLAFVGCGALAWACGAPPPLGSVEPDAARIRSVVDALEPIAGRLAPPLPGDWLEQFPERPQTFDDYLATDPVTARGERRVIYLQPLGAMSPARRKVVTLAADFLGRYFMLPVTVLPDRSLDSVPAESRRPGPYGEQVLADHVISKMLLSELPIDAAALIALTSADLYPEPSWNFVFGVANTQERVGVWSIARYGEPGDGPDAFRLCLLRTLKVATHETGHIFSMPHCALYACSMNGSNSLPETDRHPLDLCPECTGKLGWATCADLAERLRGIARFCREQGLLEDRVPAEQALASLVARDLAGGGGAPALSSEEESARRAVEARHAEQAAALTRRDAEAFRATMMPDARMRLTNGMELAGEECWQLVRDSFKLLRSVERAAYRIEAFGAHGTEAFAVVRHEFAKRAVWRDGAPRDVEGALVQRERWTRTEDGWRLNGLEESHYEGLMVDGKPSE